MNRDLKFRAWDKTYNNMWGNKQSCEMLMRQAIFNELGLADNTGCNYGDFVIFMQFTGLTDKNGKEIYEGDIVRILYTDWPSNRDSNISLEDYKKSISHFGYVAFHNDRWVVNILSKKYGEKYPNSIYPGTHGEIEVIGNIYENAEILSVKPIKEPMCGDGR